MLKLLVYFFTRDNVVQLNFPGLSAISEKNQRLRFFLSTRVHR